ncbi:hypothetical protein GGF46_000230 [Coemansia sp. RSA 552]|nr:hypothetical protein GGF46_000230 [Coemansia sp. RSA 552]
MSAKQLGQGNGDAGRSDMWEPPSLPQSSGSSTGSDGQIEDMFTEDPAVMQASRRIRRILFRKREQEIAHWPRLRRNLHIIFYEPSSMRSRVYIGFSTMVLLLFLIVFMIDTMPQYRVRRRWREIAYLVNLTTASFFALEWVLRFYAFHRRWKYLFQPMTVVDVLGIFPGFVRYDTGATPNFGNVKWLRALQVLRVLRVLRLTEYSVELYVTVRTLRKSLVQIIVVMLVIFSVLLTGCFLLFFAENDQLDLARVEWLRKDQGVLEASPFQNIFFCIYWGFVTITTVGYGDYTPVSPWGQVIACLTMLVGVFTIVFPTSIISNNFASEWEAFRTAQKIHEQRMLQRESHRKRRELSRLWSYANQPYDGDVHASPSPRATTPSSEELQISGPSSGGVVQVPGHEAAGSKVTFDRGDGGGHLLASHSPSPFGGPAKIRPKEYDRIIDVSKKVEKGLGIPGISLGDIDMDNEVNQSLVVSAMYSKLYNNAFTTLCERMVLRLIESSGYESIDSISEFLEHDPNSETIVRSWPHENKLTMLEHKVLGYVLNNVKSRINPDIDIVLESEVPDVASEPATPAPSAYEQPHTTDPGVTGAGQRAEKVKQKIQAGLRSIASKLPMTHTPPAHEPIQEYIIIITTIITIGEDIRILAAEPGSIACVARRPAQTRTPVVQAFVDSAAAGFASRNGAQLAKLFVFSDRTIEAFGSRISMAGDDEIESYTSTVSDPMHSQTILVYLQYVRDKPILDPETAHRRLCQIAELFKAILASSRGAWLIPTVRLVALALCTSALQMHSQRYDADLAFTQAAAQLLQLLITMLADNSTPLEASKKVGAMYVAAQLLRISLRTNAAPGAYAAKALEVKRLWDNNPEAFSPHDRVSYSYWLGRYWLVCYSIDQARPQLEYAFNGCPQWHYHNKRVVLRHLFVANMIRGRLPSPYLLEKYEMEPVYGQLVHCFGKGDLAGFRTALVENMELFRSQGNFLILLERTTLLIYRNVLQRMRKYILAPGGGNSKTLSYSDILTAFRVSSQDVDMDILEMESILTSLLSQKMVLGYLFHHQRVLNLSKKNAFPPLSQIGLPRPR